MASTDLTPELMALLDKVTDPTHRAIFQVREDLLELRRFVLGLTTVKDKRGDDCDLELWEYVDDLDTAIESLIAVLDGAA